VNIPPEPPYEDHYVFESPHVGLLMTIGSKRINLDRKAQAAMEDPTARFGAGLADGSIHGNPEQAQVQARIAAAENGECWYGVVDASLELLRGSQNRTELVDRVLSTAALMVAWAEDVESRAA
jgi:hypothetical protein